MDNYILAESNDAPDLASPFATMPFPSEVLQGAAGTEPLKFELHRHTKLGGMVARLEKEFQKDEVRRAVFHGIGDCCVKCISCVEIAKKNWNSQHVDSPPLHQWSVSRVSKSVDVWAPTAGDEPSKDKGLDRIVVEKCVPQLYVLLSKDPFPECYRCESQQSSNEKFPSFLTHEAPPQRHIVRASGKPSSSTGFAMKRRSEGKGERGQGGVGGADRGASGIGSGMGTSGKNPWRRPERVSKQKLTEIKKEQRLRQKQQQAKDGGLDEG